MKLFLFDIDGTLVTSKGAGRRALRTALAEVFGGGEAIDRCDLGGKTDQRIVFEVMEAEGHARDAVRERLDDVFEAYARHLTREIGAGRGVATLPGVTALVRRLDATDGAMLGLVTGNIEEGARIKLAPTGLWTYFPVGAFGSDDAERRRLPSLAARRAQALVGRGFRPADVVVIGDTPLDIDCARHFGAVAVAVATGQHSRAALAAEGPDLLFDDLADVDQALATLLGFRP